MQVAEVKTSSSASPNVQAKRQPFFSKDGEDSFFSKSNNANTSFFNPTTLQPKLTIGQPNDKYEVEADAMADKVVQNLSEPKQHSSVIKASGGTVQKKCAACEEKEKVQKKMAPLTRTISSVQRKSIFESNAALPEESVQTKGIDAPLLQRKCSTCENNEEQIQAKSNGNPEGLVPDLQRQLDASKGKGNFLTPDIQRSMESGFGVDFSKIRVHTGSSAIQMNKALNAQAFTHGSDVYFNQGKYDTQSGSGKHLLAHELTHTVQQGAALPSVQKKEETNAAASKLSNVTTDSSKDTSSIIQQKSQTTQYKSTDATSLKASQTASLTPTVARSTLPNLSMIQSKCENCEVEEQVEEKNQQKLQKKSFIGAAANPSDEEDVTVQRRAREMEKTDYPILFKKKPNIQLRVSSGAHGSRERIVAEAQKMVGKIEAKKDDGSGRRVGAEHLLEIFHLAAKDEWPDQVIENVKYGKELPHWCGIFSVYSIKKAGIDLGYWKMGRGVGDTLQATDNPQPGDIGYFHEKQHHCIIKSVNGDTIESIDGNSGNFSEVIEKTRPRSAFTGGFMTAFTGSEKIIQKKDDTADSINSGANNLQDKLSSTSGAGTPMDQETKGQMESGFGVDFSGVNIHTDSRAVEMSNDLGAQAFTHGNDIYFNEGKYSTETTSGRHLLAHELTHTVQQGATSVQKKLSNIVPAIQKDENENTKPPYKIGEIELHMDGKKLLIIPSLPIPTLKKRNKAKYDGSKLVNSEVRRNIKRDTNEQSLWNKGVKPDLKNKVADKLANKPHVSAQGSSKKIYYLRPMNQNRKFRLFGTESEITTRTVNPYFDRSDETRLHSPDHIVEYQLDGPDDISNLELLDATANASAGSLLRASIEKQIRESLEALVKEFENTAEKPIPTYEEIREGYDVEFKTVTYDLVNEKGDGKKYWNLDEIKTGKHLDRLEVMEISEIEQENLRGSPTELVIYPLKGSGIPLRMPDWNPDQKTKKGPIKGWLPNFVLDEIYFEPIEQEGKQQGLITGRFFEKSQDFPIEQDVPLTLEILKMTGVDYGGYINQVDLPEKKLKHALKFKPLSPIEFYEAYIDSNVGLYAKGKILPSIPLLEKADIDLVISGKDIMLQKTFSSGEIDMPKPFSINDTSFTISYGNNGLAFGGQIDFGIDKIGSGKLKGDASFNGFAISGDFNFESKWFEPAEISVGYKRPLGEETGEAAKGIWDIKGHLGLKKDVKGIKNAELIIAYRENQLTGEGNAEFSIPGLDKVAIKGSFNNSDNFSIAGEVSLAKIHGLKSGKGAATIQMADEVFKLSMSGTAVPDIPKIPGLATSFTVSYEDGLFKVEGTAEYLKGMLKGDLTVGVTNGNVDDDGKVTAAQGEQTNLKIYGNGGINITIAEGLSTELRAYIDENADLYFSGKIDVKKAPFPEFKKDVPLLDISKDIPIVGIPFASVFLRIGGGASLHLLWEPLIIELKTTLDKASLKELEAGELGGTAELKLHSSAEAKAKLFIKIGAGLEMAVIKVVATGKGDVGLGVKGDAGLDANADWDLEKGMQIKNAVASIAATPLVEFTLSGAIDVELNLLVKSINIYHHPIGKLKKELDLSHLGFKAELPVEFGENGKIKNVELDKLGSGLNKESAEDIAGQATGMKDPESEKQLSPEELARQEIKRQIRDILAQKTADTSLDLYAFADDLRALMAKSTDPDLQNFVIKTIEEEIKNVEYEEFSNFKNTLLNSDERLQEKLDQIKSFEEFYLMIDPIDIKILQDEVYSQFQSEVEPSETNVQQKSEEGVKSNRNI